MTIKQKIGKWLIPRLPFNRHVFSHFRLEINAMRVRLMNHIYLPWILRLINLKDKKSILANIGSGPFGKEGFVNVDLFPYKGVSLVYDCRKKLPFSDNSCKGIHVEHFIEHLDPSDELPFFLKDCLRCLEKDGVLRVIVPDASLYIKAYTTEGWDMLENIGCGRASVKSSFSSKIEALNHIFLQGYEHMGGFDDERITYTLKTAGFNKIKKYQWRKGNFPEGCIDREQHKLYSMYYEGEK